MTYEQAQEVCDILRDGYCNADVRENYSGRGMYGKTCIGIVYNGPLTLVGAACIEVGMDYGDIPTRTDSMGLSTIVY